MDLFTNVSFGGLFSGDLITFGYPRSMAIPRNVIHDQNPLIIFTDNPGRYLRGVNLHYLTFPYLKNILKTFGNNKSFSYESIKNDYYVKRAFRSYIKTGVVRPRKLDIKPFLEILGVVKNTFSVDEIDNIRNFVQEQIKQRL